MSTQNNNKTAWESPALVRLDAAEAQFIIGQRGDLVNGRDTNGLFGPAPGGS